MGVLLSDTSISLVFSKGHVVLSFSVEVILRAEAVETAQAGDKCDFTGTLIVVPDVGTMSMPGARAETGSRTRGNEGYESEGLRGLKALGVRDLCYRLSYLACTVTPCNRKVSKLVECAMQNLTLAFLQFMKW